MEATLITIRTLLVLMLCALGLLARAADGASPLAETARTRLPLTEWAMAVDRAGTAPREAWAAEVPGARTLTLPLSARHLPMPADVLWLTHAVTLPADPPGEPVLLLEQPVGVFAVYADGAPCGQVVGNGFRQRVPLPASTRRITLRVETTTLPPALRRTAPFLRSAEVELQPGVRVESLIPVFDPAQRQVLVRYRLSARTETRAQLTLELFTPTGKKPVARQTVSLILSERALEGSRPLAVKKMAPWRPETPTVYRLRATLQAPSLGSDLRELPCGACPVTLTEDAVLLAGLPVVLKGLRLASGPYTDAQMREELALAKRAGFNAVMTDGAAPTDALLALADTLGLLVIVDVPPTAGAPYTPDLDTAVEQIGHHPCVIAWSWQDDPDVSISALRARDPARIALIRTEKEARLIGSLSTPEMRCRLVDPLGTDELAHEPLPLLAIGTPTPVAQQSAGGWAAGSAEEARLQHVRQRVEDLRLTAHPLGYFLPPALPASFTGLRTPEGWPTPLYLSALAFNGTPAIILRLPLTAARGATVPLQASILNEQRITGSVQLFRIVQYPSGASRIHKLPPFTLTGERVQPIRALEGLVPEAPGPHHVTLLLLQHDAVLSTTKRSVRIVEKPGAR